MDLAANPADGWGFDWTVRTYTVEYRPMARRIFHILESLSPGSGSVAVSVRGLDVALRSKGYDSMLVAGNGDGTGDNPDRRPADVQDGIDACAIVHIHGWGYPLAWRAARDAIRKGRPFVISPLGGLTPGAGERTAFRARMHHVLVGRRLIGRAAAVTTINDEEERLLARDRHIRKTVPLRYGLDFAEYDHAAAPSDESAASPERNGPQPPEGRILLVLAPIHPAEGYVPFLKALAELGVDRNGWSVVVAGRAVGSWRAMLEAAVHRKGGSERVLFTDAPDVAAQCRWLSLASLLVSPSLRVRCPVSVLQAVACGVPTVVTRCAAPRDLSDVLRVCAPIRGDMKLALRSSLSLSGEEQSAAAHRAREYARSVYDWAEAVNDFVRLYDSIGGRSTG